MEERKRTSSQAEGFELQITDVSHRIFYIVTLVIFVIEQKLDVSYIYIIYLYCDKKEIK